MDVLNRRKVSKYLLLICFILIFCGYIADFYIFLTVDNRLIVPKSERSGSIQTISIHCIGNFFKTPTDRHGSKLEINNSITVVSAYFKLGPFQKGRFGKLRSTGEYLKWASVFHYIVNPVIMYTDDRDFAQMIIKHRKKANLNTVVMLIKREGMWAFGLRHNIKLIYHQPEYPKHHPNTVLPDYSCAMHAKFELVIDAIKRNVFQTQYYEWLDIGLFRDIASDKQYFHLHIPENFISNRVSYSEVNKFSKNESPWNIIKHNMVWVGGATFIGKWDVLLKFCAIYRKAVEYFIKQKLMNTDQQLLYAIYSQEGRKVIKPEVELQVFSSKKGQFNPWFYLGYICRKMLNQTHSTTVTTKWMD